MKKRVIALALLGIGLLLSFPGVSYAENQADIYTAEKQIAAQKHWAQQHVIRLEAKYKINELMNEYELGNKISQVELEKLIGIVVGDGNLDLNFDTTTREEVISKLVELLAEKKDINLDDIFFAAVVVFNDVSEIDLQYKQNIMYAFSTGIVTGKGDGLFRPKELVTYAEAFTLVDRIDQLMNDNLLGVDAHVVQGDSVVRFDFSLKNVSELEQKLIFSSGQLFEITVYNNKGMEVYRYSRNKVFIMAMVNKSIAPGGKLPFQVEWDKIGNDNKQVEPGHYTAAITFITRERQHLGDNQLSTTISFEIMD